MTKGSAGTDGEDEAARTSEGVAALRRSLVRIGVEILVGFIGVYAAFALSAYKDRRDLVDRRHQIKRALIAEIKPMVDHAKTEAPGYDHYLALFDSSVAAGRPAPRPFFESIGVSDHVWEATKQAGGLELIDVPTFVALSAFYNENSQMYAQYGQLRDYSVAEVLPRVANGPGAFLVPETKHPLPSLVIYRRALQRLGGMNRTMVFLGDSLLGLLARDTI